MIYENGKYIIYTTNNNRFELSENDVKDIIQEFLDNDYRNRTNIFSDIIQENIESDIFNISYWSNEDGYISQEEIENIKEDIKDNISNKYYLIERGDIYEKF